MSLSRFPQRKTLGRHLLIALLACLIAGGAANARSSRKKAHSGAVSFSYYLLSLSYAPDFCAQPSGDKDPRECGTGRYIGFVVHGLWPQGENSRGPENCGSASPVSQDIVRSTLRYIPTESLIQHEWKTHGTCTGLAAADYFSLIRRARDSVVLPEDLKAPRERLLLTPVEIGAKFAASNPRFPREAFRLSCYPNKELQEMRVCLNEDLSPRACTASTGQCMANKIILLPVR